MQALHTSRLALFSLFFVLLVAICPGPRSATAAAGRAELTTIAKNPYLAALLIDAGSGKVLFADNADTKVYPASVLKLMVLLITLERLEQGSLHLDEMVQITPTAAKVGGSQVYLDSREQFSVDDLLYALMVQSANDAATALAIHIAGSPEAFVALMNAKAKELGMNKTQFHSVHGLPPSAGQQPDITTARDFSLLSLALIKRPEALKYTSTQERGFRGDSFIMRNHNKLLTRVNGCDGLKTGYYRAGGFSIATTAQRNGVRILALVMGCSDAKVRDAKAAELLEKGFAMVPAQPEAQAMARPQVAAGLAQNAQPGMDESELAAATEPASANEALPATVEPFAWGTFLMGVAAGFALCVAALGVTGFLMRRSSIQPRQRRR